MTGRLLFALLLSLSAVQGWCQTEMPHDAHPSFQVATIKPSDPNSQQQGIDFKGHSVNLLGETLTSMIGFAYQLQREQIVGGPEWMSRDRYDVAGVPDAEGEPDLTQIQDMVRKLLVERFGMNFHRDRQTKSYYAIVTAKSEPKLVRSTASLDRMPHQSMSGDGKGQQIKFRNNRMSDFALAVQLIVDRPVVDETGLAGRFDFTLRWQPGDAQSADADAPPALFTAMVEQLGLKLQPKKGLVDVVVIDKVAKPSAN